MKQQMTLEEIRALREELDQLEKKGHLTTELQQVRDQLVASEVALLAAAEGAH
jgi:ribosomal protein L19E